MRIKNPSKRLNKFWGKVDRKHIEIISKFIKGKKVLDMGAGYGTTTTYLQDQGFDVLAIDFDDDSIKVAKEINSTINYLKLNVEDLPFENSTFDTLILRDALHHFYGEADFSKIKTEINRILKPDGVVIFFDPNINFLLKILRKISNHNDEECSFEEAIKIMNELNLNIIHNSFNTIYTLPLSGGYVGVNFIPQINIIQSALLFTERIFEKLIQNKLGRQIAWRYMIVGLKASINSNR